MTLSEFRDLGRCGRDVQGIAVTSRHKPLDTGVVAPLFLQINTAEQREKKLQTQYTYRMYVVRVEFPERIIDRDVRRPESISGMLRLLIYNNLNKNRSF